MDAWARKRPNRRAVAFLPFPQQKNGLSARFFSENLHKHLAFFHKRWYDVFVFLQIHCVCCQAREARPIGLKYEFKVRTLLDETIAIPAGKDAGKVNTTLALNETGAEIFSLLQQGKDEPAIVAALQKKYGDDDARLPAYVSAFLGKLRQAGILE